MSDLIESENSNKTDFITAWPTDDPGISRQQAKDIQQGLLNAGYDIGEVDGIIGDNTRKAIQQYQTSKGVFPADGRAGQKFYRLIMGNQGNQSQPNYSQYNQPMSQPSSQSNTSNDSIGRLIQQQDGARKVISGDGNLRIIRTDNGQ